MLRKPLAAIINLNNAMTTRDQDCFFSAPKFFKIILDPTANNLRIPVEFMRRHGRNLGNRVFLKVPGTRVLWEVKLVHSSNGETLLQKGWKEFCERYSLGFGHFLVFEYINRNSQLFKVVIFDTTASEINYSDFEAEASGTESDDSIVVLEHLPDFPPQMFNQDSDRRRLRESSSTGRVQKKQKNAGKEATVAYEKALAFAAGHNFRNPFFISQMQPSYIAAKYGLITHLHGCIVHFASLDYTPTWICVYVFDIRVCSELYGLQKIHRHSLSV
ncbi:hypothetical protein ACS0TY_028667 [Phlomoides rotata]